MDDDVIIRVEHVSKAYRLGHERSNLRAALPGSLGEPRGKEWFQALDDVSFTVARGEAFGIIGPNGAGKSTMLKVLTGVVEPTSGQVVRPRDLVSIIELGLGFDPDLTGDENLEYGGAMLGLSGDQVAAKRDEILAFAELEEFATMPVKRYSTGMVARLGFALATSVDAEVFIVDEVLSVGDWGFQRKSLERMRKLNKEGSTIVFVSHNLWVVNQLCTRAALLDQGRVAVQGPVQRVLGIYLGETPTLASRDDDGPMLHTVDSAIQRQAEASSGGGVPLATGTEAGANGPDWRPAVVTYVRCEPTEISPGGALLVVGEIEVRRAAPWLRLVIGAYWEGFAGFAAPDELPSSFLQEPGTYRVEVQFPMVTAAPGVATFQLALVNTDEPDDPEQLLPNAVDRGSADFKVSGDVTSRPGVYFPRVVLVDRMEPSARTVRVEESRGPGVPDGWRLDRGDLMDPATQPAVRPTFASKAPPSGTLSP